MRRLVWGAAVLTSLGLSDLANAAILGFDDLMSQTPVPANYGGLCWTDWGAYASETYQRAYGNNYGAPSPGNFAHNRSGLMVVTTSGADRFNFIGAAVSTWAFNNDFSYVSARSLTVNGYLGSTLVGSLTWDLACSRFETKAANLRGIDRLEFVSTGDYRWWILDNFEYAPVPKGDGGVVPEPTTMLAGALLLVPLGIAGGRRFFNRKQSRNV